MIQKITVIDLFAGPGGLGEGFSNCKPSSPFKTAMSVEKEANAHKTLTLRAFYRKLKDKRLYNEYVTSPNPAARKIAMNAIELTPEWGEAMHETLGAPHALGNSSIFEKWKNGEVPSDSDFEARTQEQLEIDGRIEEVKKATGRAGEKFIRDCDPLIVIGGPPCQAYSTIGRGVRAGNPNHNQDHDERFFLYKEYADTILKAQPDLFIMENVSGIGSAKLANGELIFPKIIKRLEYLKDQPKEGDTKVYHIYSLVKRPSDFVGTEDTPSEADFLVRATDFGVPQDRRRVILLGIRAEHDPDNSMNLTMSARKLLAPSIGETISSLPRIRSSFSFRKADYFHTEGLDHSDVSWLENYRNNLKQLMRQVSGRAAIKRGVDGVIRWEKECAKYKEAKKQKVSRDAVVLTAEQISVIEAKTREYTSLLEDIYPQIANRIQSLLADISEPLSVGNDSYIKSEVADALRPERGKSYLELEAWLKWADCSGALNHRAKQHMPEDLKRYLFTALWTDAARKNPPPSNEASPSPKTKFFPIDLASDHDSWYSDNFQDRFRAHAVNYRAKTITAHMHKDGHANIHFDPEQCRSLTVREAARIQTFPDNYFFEGGQSAQYLQVGNAVPPFLAKQIALHVLNVMKHLGIGKK